MLYKDACNGKSNQQNLGTIKCSNLCTEIVEYTAPDETAVCNLASLALPKFVRPDGIGSPCPTLGLVGSYLSTEPLPTAQPLLNSLLETEKPVTAHT